MKVQPLTHTMLISTQQSASALPANTVTAGEVNGSAGMKVSVANNTTVTPDPNHELDFSKGVIYGSLDVTPQ